MFLYKNCYRQQFFLFSRVSDQLVNELIVDLSKELQMDDVIKKLFELEFQEL